MKIKDIFLIAIFTCCLLFSFVRARRLEKPYVAIFKERCKGADRQYYVDRKNPQCCPCSEEKFPGQQVIFSCDPPNQYVAYEQDCIVEAQFDEYFPRHTEPVNSTHQNEKVTPSLPYVDKTDVTKPKLPSKEKITISKVTEQLTPAESTYGYNVQSPTMDSPPEFSATHFYIVLIILAVFLTIIFIVVMLQMKKICRKKPNSVIQFLKKVLCSKSSESESSQIPKIATSHSTKESESVQLISQISVIEEDPEKLLSSPKKGSSSTEESTKQYKGDSCEESNKYPSDLVSEPQEMCYVADVRFQDHSFPSLPRVSNASSGNQMNSPSPQAVHIRTNNGSVHYGPVNIHQHYSAPPPTGIAYVQSQHNNAPSHFSGSDFREHQKMDTTIPVGSNVQQSGYPELTNTCYKNVYPSQSNPKNSQIVTNVTPISRQTSKESYGRPVVSGPMEHDEDNTITMTTDNSGRMSRQCSSISASSVDDSRRCSHTRSRSLVPEERDIRGCGDGGELHQTAKFQTAKYRPSSNSNNNAAADILRRVDVLSGVGFQTSRLQGYARPFMQRERVVQADVERQYSTRDVSPTYLEDSQDSCIIQRWQPSGDRDST